MPSGTMQRDVGAASAARSHAVADSIAAKAAPTKPAFSPLKAYYRADERLRMWERAMRAKSRGHGPLPQIESAISFSPDYCCFEL